MCAVAECFDAAYTILLDLKHVDGYDILILRPTDSESIFKLIFRSTAETLKRLMIVVRVSK